MTKRSAPDGATTTYRYDPVGNVVELQDPTGSVTAWRYDAMNRVTRIVRPGGMNSEYTYDSAGRLIAERDALGHAKNYFYFPAGDLAKVGLPNGEQTSYQFDPEGFGMLVSAQTSDRRTYRYAYDRAGRLIREKTPWGEVIEYSYDKGDRLVKKTSSSGNTIEYSYDAADRLISVKASDGLLETFQYDPQGNLIEIRGKDFAKKLSYNRFGELIAEEYPLLSKTVKYTYDSRGNRLSVEVPTDVKINYTYDRGDRLTGVTYDGGKKISIAYDALGRKSEMAYPNGVKIQYSYNKLNLLEGIIYFGRSGKVIQKYGYAHDKTGRVKRITDLKGNVREFAYDANGQLIEAGSQKEKMTFTYAESLKRVFQGKGSKATEFAYNQAGQLVKAGKTNVTYDDSGNLSRKHGPGMDQRFRFNAVGRLTQVETPSHTVAYGYSPECQRVAKQIGKTKTYYVYDGFNLLMVLDHEKKPKKTFIHAQEVDSPLVMVEGNKSFFYLRDHQGTTIALVDQNGEIAVEYEYDPFGKLTVKGRTDHTLTFTGRFYDEETGVYYFRARYYDPELGIFMSPDPLQKTLAQPQDFNEYAYVQNDPVNYKDPFGLTSEYGGSERFWRRINSDLKFIEDIYKEWRKSPAEIAQVKENYMQKIRQYYPEAFDDPPRPSPPPRPSGPAPGPTRAGRAPVGGGTAGVTRAQGAPAPGPTVANRPPAGGGTAGVTRVQGAPVPTGSAGPPRGLGPLTEGKSSFAPQGPSLLGKVGYGALAAAGGFLQGYNTGSEYVERARREGRNPTGKDFAKAAGEATARAGVAVATFGASEGVITIASKAQDRSAFEEAMEREVQ
ncbi:MAG: RHS repeat domain-containing protein, partial [Candidatus Binatia bacterium]